MHLRNTRRGFTIVELLVVVAIIAILASIVMASLLSSRAKSRDAKRLADIREFRSALELYYDQIQNFPPSGAGPAYALPAAVKNAGYIKVIPTDPNGTGVYRYMGLSGIGSPYSLCSSGTCNKYILHVQLERSDNAALRGDIDAQVDNPPGTPIFYGNSVACTATPGTPQPSGAANAEGCYDIVQ